MYLNFTEKIIIDHSLLHITHSVNSGYQWVLSVSLIWQVGGSYYRNFADIVSLFCICLLCNFNFVIVESCYTYKYFKMNSLIIVLLATMLSQLVYCNSSPKKQLQIGVLKRPTECSVKSKRGDILHMHYTVRFNLWYIQVLRLLLNYPKY